MNTWDWFVGRRTVLVLKHPVSLGFRTARRLLRILDWKPSGDRAAANLPKLHFRALLGPLEGLFEAQ